MHNISIKELSARWDRLRAMLRQTAPEAGGAFVFSRLNIYHLAGTFGNGVLWMPMEGEPVFLCRRGMERAKIESPLTTIRPFKSYGDIAPLLKEAGHALPDTFAAEMNGLSWALANSFNKYMSGRSIVSADSAIGMARAHKTPAELAIMREAGRRHGRCLTELLPPLIHHGMTEMEIVRVVSDLFYEQGHHGILRMEKYGEEAYMGHISSGESANHSSVFNGALGLVGIHPATPHMGSREKRWERGELMMIDLGFTLEGYQTDKSHVYFAGRREDIPTEVMRAQEFCMRMQAWVAEHLKPGAVPSEIWAHSANRALREGFAEGFMGLPGNKVEFVGHGIGLAIDEYPVLANGFDLPLSEGMTIAVEPKVGIRGVGMAGVENTFEVTAAGGVSLTGTRDGITCV